MALRPLAYPKVGSWWLSTERNVNNVYRVVVVEEARRTYTKMGHQGGIVAFYPARMSDPKAQRLAMYELPYKDFVRIHRELEGEELAEVQALILLANV